MGKVLKILGFITVLMLVLFGCVFGVIAYHGTRLDRSSKAYVDVEVPAIMSDWGDRSALESRMSPRLRGTVSDFQLTKLLGVFGRLGALKKYDGCSGTANIGFQGLNVPVETAVYRGTAEFANGKAEFRVELINLGGAWKINGFHLSSPVLLN